MLESKLSASEKKCQNLEKHAAKVERSALFWKKRFQNIVSQVIKQKRRRGKEKGKAFQDYSARSRRRLRQQITNDCQEALNFLGLYELIPTRVEYYNVITHSIEEIDFVDGEDQVELQKESFDSIYGSKLDDIHMLLYIKEKFQISDNAWQELSIRSGKLPSKYSLKQRVRELNKLWNIFETPGDQLGIQMSLKESLTGQISRMQRG